MQEQEELVGKRIEFYKNTAAVGGGITGAGGILLGFADFPILIGLELKMLFDICSMYGFNVKDYKERVYILHIFELASSHVHRRKVYLEMVDWDTKSEIFSGRYPPVRLAQFSAGIPQLHRPAKMAQLLPIIGAPVGFMVNSRLIKKLGKTAMNAYRMRLLELQDFRKLSR